jgi:hypothetical protein
MPMRRSEMGNHFFASSVLKSRYVMIPAPLHIEMAATQTTDYRRSALASARSRFWHTCTQSKKKGKLKLTPDRTYLFVTVIKMEEPQYAKMAATGFSVIESEACFCEAARMTGEGARELLVEPISIL